MTWIAAGVVYAALYALAAYLRDPVARLWVGNVGLLVSPLVPFFVIFRRRHQWRGRQRVFFDALVIGAMLWFSGQLAWAGYELLLHRPQPWMNWDIIPQLCGSMMPLFALLAAPHRGERRYTASTTALDIYGVTFLFGFLCWALIIAPGLAPGGEALGLTILSYLGPAMRVVTILALLAAMSASRETRWGMVYGLLAVGVGASLIFVIGVSAQLWAGDYSTGSIADIGWILPFWFYAAAAAEAPASGAERHPSILQRDRPGPPLVLFGAMLMVPAVALVARGTIPLADPAATNRETAEDIAILGATALLILRVAIEQRVTRRYEERVRLLAGACEQTTEMIAISRGATIEYANAAFCRAFGYSVDELMSVDRRTLLENYDDPDALAMTRTLVRGEPVQGSLTLKRRDGTTFPAALAITSLGSVEGGSAHFVGVVRDMSHDVAIRDQLVRHERLSAIGELVSSIAHQINNPLQSVVGMIDVLLAADAADELRPDLERARLEAWRAGHIIRNLLAFARKAPAERLLAELNEVVRAAVALCAYDLEASRVRVADRLVDGLPLVLVNREELQQAILNLIANAQQSLTHGRNGGTVTLRTYADNSDAILEVLDDGPGVPAELASRIFEPFVTTKSITEVNGFGLSTAFGIVAAHGGRLEFVPVASGACFRITLPGVGFAGPVVHSA